MTLLEQIKEKRAAKKAELDAINAAVELRDDKTYTADEDASFSVLLEEIRKLDGRIQELAEIESRDAAAVSAAKSENRASTTSMQVNEPDMYQKGGQNSYFRDLVMSQRGDDLAARERLQRHSAYQKETRAVGNTNAAGGSGGEWAPPTWMIGDWVNLIRPARITANLFSHEDVPFGTSSINYPKLLTGTTVAIQSTQNSALSSTDPTTGFIQTGFTTLGGKNVASQQILDQGRNFDQVITKDLAAAYAQQVGTQVFLGTGTGSGTNSVINGLGAATIGSTQTWTQASPTPGGFYGQTGNLLQKFLNARLMQPTCWVMNPRRWYWLESALDSSNRPYVVPTGQAFNPLATENDGPVAMGVVGTMHGLPVVIDPLVPTNLGAGTNQDAVYLLKTDDLVLLESEPRAEVFNQPYADSLGVLFRLYAYVATILNRHPESIGVLTGTGLVTPTFAS
jgi:HK97 family phage major capsid protein